MIDDDDGSDDDGDGGDNHDEHDILNRIYPSFYPGYLTTAHIYFSNGQMLITI